MMEIKWKLILHEQCEDSFFEITNGHISLCANAGCVGETEYEEVAIFKKVADVLNKSGIDFHSKNALELKQHIEITQLKDQAQRMADALEKIIEMNRQHAQDQYGDPEKSKTWACVIVAKEALQKFKEMDNEGKEA